MKETLTTLLLGFVAAIILIYMIMAAQFESFTQPFVIMFTVPLSIMGVAVGLAIFGMALSTVAFMGIIILAGVVVNNGIVMVDYVNQLRKKGMKKYEALIEAAATRLRPILITALSTILGVLPMALSRSQGWEMRAPLGVAIASGLFVATFLTLFVVPVAYSIADRISTKATEQITKRLHGK
jgi:HAE1 family hydrophobic/amphiphilic exporter-1